MAALTIDPAVLTPRGVVGHAEPQSEFNDEVIAAINDHAALIDAGGGVGTITEVVAGTNLDGGGTSGTVTLDLEPTIDLAGAADESAIIARKSATGQTTDNLAAIHGLNTGSYVVGAAPAELFAYGVRGTFGGSRASGTGEIDAIGCYGSCSGAQTNGGIAGVATGGDLAYGVYGKATAATTNVGVAGVGDGGAAVDSGDLGNTYSCYFRGGVSRFKSPVQMTDGLTVTGDVIQASTSLGASGAKFTKTAAGSTVSYGPALHGINDGSYDTSSGPLNAIAVFGECNASISAGGNSLVVSGVYGYDDGGSNATDRIAVRGVTSASAGTNIYAGGFTNISTVNTNKWGIHATAQGDNGVKYGGYFGASGTGVNYALYTTSGDVALNVSSGDAYAYGTLVTAAAEKITSVIVPAALGAADNPNYAPAGFATARIIRLTGDAGGASTLSGLAGGALGRVITLVNVSGFAITILGASGLSTAGNRFISGIVLAASGTAGAGASCVTYWWDSTSADWRMI